MKQGMAGLVGFAVLAFGASFIVSPALAKCGRDCKRLITRELRSCRAGCPRGSAGQACRTACTEERRADKAACTAATNPTPPTCGDTTTATLPTCSGPSCSACGSCSGGGKCFVAGTLCDHRGSGAVCLAINGPCDSAQCDDDTDCPAGSACVPQFGCCATCPSSPSGAFLDAAVAGF